MDLARPYCSKRLKPKEAILVQLCRLQSEVVPGCPSWIAGHSKCFLEDSLSQAFSNKPPLIMVIPQVSLESTKVYFIEPFVCQVISMLNP